MTDIFIDFTTPSLGKGHSLLEQCVSLLARLEQDLEELIRSDKHGHVIAAAQYAP